MSDADEALTVLGVQFDAVASLFADSVAIIDGQRRISYRDLLRRAAALARELQVRGIGPRDLVGVALPRSAELIVAIVGIVRAGAAYIPIDLNQPTERRALILSDAQPQLLVTDGTWIDGVPPGVEVLALPQRQPAAIESCVRPSLADPAYVIYTSGSSGQPKGVVVTQRNVARLFTMTEPHFKFGSNDVWALFHSIGFDVSVWELWGALLHGGRLVVVPAKTARAADALHALVERESVTVLCQTPSAFRAFDAADQAAGRPVSRLKHIVFAGEALDPRTLKGWIESHGDEQPCLVNMYGPTETTIYATYRRMRAKDTDGDGRSLIGFPLTDLRIELLGPGGQPVTSGESGEIFIGGAGVTAGYLKRPDLTAERFVSDPQDQNARLYRSGDLGRSMPDGDLEFLGRLDDQVKLRGFRIELGEIEVALRKTPGISDAVVVLRQDVIPGPQLICYVVQETGRSLNARSLREHLSRRLPDYMLPSAYVRIESVPRTINDKLDRAALPLPSILDYPNAKEGECPRNNTERAIAGIFSELLNATVLTRESDFFHLGGDSLLAARVAILCHERLYVDLSIGSIFDNSTVMAFADLVECEKKRGRGLTRVGRVPRGGPIPLSPQQYALWLELKIRSDANAYNEAIAYRIGGRIEPTRLLRALQQLAQTHEVLRARLVELNGEPHLAFDRETSAVEFEFWEKSTYGEGRGLAEAAHRPFNLEDGPLWRAILRDEPDGRSLILLVIHHLILDAASEKILLHDLIAAYAKPEAPPTFPAYEFTDLAAHERACLASEREGLERFWANNLAGAELTPALPPPCTPCSPEADNCACISRHEIQPDLVKRIRDLAASWGSTPFHIYLTAYLALLRTYAASDDLVVGSPISLRDTLAAEGVVGYLLSLVALRVKLAGALSFRESVDEVARRWLDVRAHARLPMHLVLHAAHGAERADIGSPIQVFFSLLQDSCESVLIDGYSLQQIDIAPARAKVELFLLVRERKGDASLVLEFRRGTIDPKMAERLLRHLETLLIAATEHPEWTLAKLPLTDQIELTQLRAWEGHSTSYPRDSTVVEIFEEVARKHKGQTALVDGDNRISYETLNSSANAIAAMLRNAGVSEGDRVPLLLPRGAQFIACAIAVLKCGAAYVPFDPSYPPERLQRMLAELGARFGLGGSEVPFSDVAVTWLDPSVVEELPSLQTLRLQVKAEDPAYIIFTSGSTGAPKGVVVPHRAIVRLVFGQDFARIGPAETWLHMAPPSFDAATLEIWAPLLHGGRCVIIGGRVPTPLTLSDVIHSERVTSAWFTASLFNAYVDEAPECLSGLEQILVGGEALSPAHLRQVLDHVPGVELINGYGPTENTTFTSCHRIQREDLEPRYTVPIGRPIAHTTIHVLDRDGRPTPIGIPGELVAGGDGVALGYLRESERTEGRFLTDTLPERLGARHYRSGDRVRWRPEGTLEFLGRFDNQTKIRGHRVEPGDIAACLEEHKLVRQAVVVAERAASGGRQLIAYIVPQSSDIGSGKLSKLLTHHITQRLPPYMVPKSLQFLREFPLKPNGKIDLPSLSAVQNEPGPPKKDTTLTVLESEVLEIFRNVLNHKDLAPDDNFFEAGGDSLLAIQILFRIETKFGRELPTSIMAEPITARRVAGSLEDETIFHSKLPAGIAEIKHGTGDKPIFCIPGLGGTALMFRTLAEKMNTGRPVHAIEPHNLKVETIVFESLAETASAVVQCVRHVQPVGPYVFFGYSYGGNLAVEVTRQLVDQGQSVQLAVILDAYAPDVLRHLNGLRKVAAHARIILSLKHNEAYAYISSRVGRLIRSQDTVAIEPATSALDSATERRITEISEPCLRALKTHRLKKFAGRIVLVHATDLGDWFEVADSSGTLGWGSVCQGGVDVIQIACSHLDLFKEPNVTELAGHINELLRAIGN